MNEPGAPPLLPRTVQRRAWSCPFCGSQEGRTKEHVWPQWLRASPGATQLLQDATGKRSPNLRAFIVRDENGTYQSSSEALPQLAELLPEVSVGVCKACNTGWMSQLENETRSLLLPSLVGQLPISLSLEDQALLAAWATKTFMTYSLTLGQQSNPFSGRDYREMREGRALPASTHVWLFSACSRWAQVGIQVKTWALYKGSFRPDVDPDNSALGFLAAGGLVFLLVKTPHPILTDLLAPPDAPSDRLHKLSDAASGFTLDRCELGEPYMDAVHAWSFSPDRLHLPDTIGLREEQVDDIATAWRAGVSPEHLRRITGRLRSIDPAKAERHKQHVLATAVQLAALQDPEGAALLLRRMGREHFYRGDYTGAAELLELAVQTPNGGLNDEAEQAYQVAQSFWNLSDPRAAQWYKKSIELGLTDNAPRFGLVDSLMFAGEYETALNELLAIEPRDDHEASTVLIANGAFSFLVEDLNLSKQERHPLEVQGDHALTEASAWDMIMTCDATSRWAWAALGPEDDRPTFHAARAWFGDSVTSWIIACLYLESQGHDDTIPGLLELGISRVPGLALGAEALLEGMGEQGIPVDTIQQHLLKARAHTHLPAPAPSPQRHAD